MSPNHRAVDVVSLIHSAKPPTLQAKFFYGPLNMATLTEEMVRQRENSEEREMGLILALAHALYG